MDQSVAETSIHAVMCHSLLELDKTWQASASLVTRLSSVMHCIVPNSLCPNIVCVVHIFHSALLWHTEVTGMASCLSWYWFLFMLHQASFWYWTVPWLSDAGLCFLVEYLNREIICADAAVCGQVCFPCSLTWSVFEVVWEQIQTSNDFSPNDGSFEVVCEN